MVNQDAVVIGGGVYGILVALYLVTQRGFQNVALVEAEKHLCQRASYHNQARVHAGYHYPRSFTTAYRSQVNLPRFLRDWPQTIQREVTHYYAVARYQSKVNAKQFQHFCGTIGVAAQEIPLTAPICQLLNWRLLEALFQVQEYVFDTTQWATWAQQALKAAGIQVFFNTRVTHIQKAFSNLLSVRTTSETHNSPQWNTRYVFNCTYSGLNQFQGDFPNTTMPLKHEAAEMALIEVPPSLQGIALTLIDGPFFSLMPFPPRQLHALSHVRYTPHFSWLDSSQVNPYTQLEQYDKKTRVDRMLRDATRYLPELRKAYYKGSLFEVKTILPKNETDDGRPILFQKYPQLPGCFSILGGKIDNVYDVLEKLDQEALALVPQTEENQT